MKINTLRALMAAAAGALIVLPAATAFTPDGVAVTKVWAAGALWLLPPLLLSLRKNASAGADNSWNESLPEIILLLFVLGSLFSGATAHHWHYFISWRPSARFNPLQSGPASLFFLWSFFWMVLLVGRSAARERLLLLLLLGTQALCFLALLSGTEGLPLYRDDHPSFMFRLWAFGTIFPRLTSYTPYWNGGVMEGVITKTGVLGPGLLLWPLWKLASIRHVYTPAVGFLYIVFIPWLTVFSLRFMRLSWLAALAGGLLSVAVSHTWFLWFLHFGTIGANLTAAFVLPFGACLYRIVLLDDRSMGTVLLLSLAALFLLFWPPGAIMLLFILSGLLFHLGRLSFKKTGLLLFAGTVTALFYLRPAAVILKGADLLGFVFKGGGSGANEALPAGGAILSGLTVLQEEALRASPLLVVLGLGGLLVMRERSLRRWLAPMVLLFLLMAGWGEMLLPNLQLGRMVIPLLLLAVIPAAVTLERLLRLTGPRSVPLRAALLALLLLTGLNGARIYGNGGPAPYVTLSPGVDAIVDTVRREVPSGGRVLFAGTTVHAYGRGHVAFLPALAGREMMACDYYAFPPQLVEQNYPPRKYRLTREDTFRFMDLYNVALVFTYHRDWRDFFLAQPERYEALTVSYGKHEYSTFRVLRTPAPLLKGEGAVEADFNVIRVKPAPGQERLVLRYNWHAGLVVDGPAVIKPQPVWKDLRFIAVRPNGAEEVVIRHKSWL